MKDSTLIAIATNQGEEQLAKLLDSMKGTIGDNDFVLVVDTTFGKTNGSRPITERGMSGTTVSIKGGYDTGAYIHAFKMYPDFSRYVFMHDSMEVIDPEWLRKFSEPLEPKFYGRDGTPYTSVGAVSYARFHFFFDENPAQQEWVERQYGHDFPYWGIFGPIFCASNEAMKAIRLPDTPTNKLEQQAGERTWAMAFHNAGFEVATVNEEFWPQKMADGKANLLRKHFIHRK